MTQFGRVSLFFLVWVMAMVNNSQAWVSSLSLLPSTQRHRTALCLHPDQASELKLLAEEQLKQIQEEAEIMRESPRPTTATTPTTYGKSPAAPKQHARLLPVRWFGKRFPGRGTAAKTNSSGQLRP